jgi:hypothetical protein
MKLAFHDTIAKVIAAQRFPAWAVLVLARKCHETCGYVTFYEICVGCFKPIRLAETTRSIWNAHCALGLEYR